MILGPAHCTEQSPITDEIVQWTPGILSDFLCIVYWKFNTPISVCSKYSTCIEQTSSSAVLQLEISA